MTRIKLTTTPSSLGQAQRDVAQFMREVKGLYVPGHPWVPLQAVSNLCLSLIFEEAKELDKAAYDLNHSVGYPEDFVQVADALADLIYVVLYTANAYGIDLEPVWQEVQRSNMTKKGGPKRADGKQLKGPDYSPPNLLPIIEHQIKGGNGL